MKYELIKHSLTSFLILFVYIDSWAAPSFTGQDGGPGSAIYLHSRYYDSETGTFLTKDLLGITGGVNGYQYCSSDPINKIDPNGKNPGALLNPIVQFSVILAGSAGGVISTAIGDIIKGKLSTGQQYDNAAISGVLTTEIAVGGDVESPAGLGATYNGIKSIIDQSTDDSSTPIDYGTVFQQMLLGGVSGQISGAIGENVTLPSSITGRGSLTAVGNWAMSYAQNNPAVNFAMSTGAKLATTMIVKEFGEKAVDGTIDGLVDLGTDAAKEVLDIFGLLFGEAPSGASGNQGGSSGGSETSGSQNVSTDFWGVDFKTGLPVGGVLLNTAATLVGQNLSDITGAMYDPVSGQFLFLGTNSPTPVKNINLDYLTTALQAVYGSAVPPFVTLMPSAEITSSATYAESLTVYVYQNGTYQEILSGGQVSASVSPH